MPMPYSTRFKIAVLKDPLVVQRIERELAELMIEVQFLSRGHTNINARRTPGVDICGMIWA